MLPLLTGIDRLIAEPKRYLPGMRVGLVVNQTSRTATGEYAIDAIRRLPDLQLKRLFAPEHGLYGVDQDMISVDDDVDPSTQLRVISLYGQEESSLAPRIEDLKDLDCLIFDIQDIGSRYYTFIYTMAYCMERCGEAGIPIIVCDRPNPINGVDVEGNRVGDAWRSFVGRYPIANRHGMTAGELARLFNKEFNIQCDLTVISMSQWKREHWFDQTGLAWTPPSPNMPTLSTATVYPGMCMLEGTNLSEGRGTTLPFEQIGAPFIDAHKLAKALQSLRLSEVYFRPHYFKPMFQKWSGQVCGGVQIHVMDRKRFAPLATGLGIIHVIRNLYESKFSWRTEAYEFVSDRLAIDLLYGNDQFRTRWIKEAFDLEAMRNSWREESDAFLELRKNHLLY
ncbi:MAG: DUF1343 domain-containing protein [Candidatus Nitrohelix vancouverensis]|uniref:DUF1343 domain-containing protein n=1 Tax=Candidatus Nitrohelix vancouverensis TaxID=2705534 RepID=A0A7T0C4Y6_9BACT|nr:MAG: DUF1343 domain-containing protein [Candidatus Nitrohelix vancouverensis]